MMRRQLNKDFTEHVLKGPLGTEFNGVLIWKTAQFFRDFVFRISRIPFNIVAVGSYSIICKHISQQNATEIQRFAREKFNQGTDLDCKIIGNSQEEHARLFQSLSTFLYDPALSQERIDAEFNAI